MGLAQLYHATGKPKYLALLEQLIVLRDAVPDGTDDNQDRLPLKEHREITGHAVRANYLYAGLTDLYLETGDLDYKIVLESVWKDLVSKKLYITGGCGALYDGVSPYGCDDYNYIQRTHQCYGRAYELPNTAGYNETCASIGFYLWNFRMVKAFRDSKYADYMERALYNSILSGINLEGDKYFYTNALRCLDNLPYSLKWSRHREPYISSFCCPPNVIRTIAGTEEKICIIRENGIAFILYGDSKVCLQISDGKVVEFKMNSNYPWDGEIELILERETVGGPFPVFLRIPDWASSFSLSINGQKVEEAPTLYKGFISLLRTWNIGDQITLSLPMNVSIIESHPMVEESRNHAAVSRGPIVYCLETIDLPPEYNLGNIYIAPKTTFSCKKSIIESTEIRVLEGELWYGESSQWREGELYREYQGRNYHKIKTRLIPYFCWDNRNKGEMTVWLPLLPQN